MVLGDDGIIKKAQGAGSMHAYKSAQEKMEEAKIVVETEIIKQQQKDAYYNAEESIIELAHLVRDTIIGDDYSVAITGSNEILMKYENSSIKKAEEGKPTQDGNVSGTLTLVNNKVEFDFDEGLSEYGIYYNRPYVFEEDMNSDGIIDGKITVIFYEDKKVIALTESSGVEEKNFEAQIQGKGQETVIIGSEENVIEIPVTNSGKTIEMDSLLLNLEEKMVEKEAKEPYTPKEITDSNGNQWVWIEVPNDIYPEGTEEDDYEAIETAMIAYASDYRNEAYEDEHVVAGFGNAEEYNKYKQGMLKSVYKNEGFWVGKYEAGTPTARYSRGEQTQVVVKPDMYPYNYVDLIDAQSLSNSLATEEGKTSSLMFGIQWDLMLKFIEEKEDYIEYIDEYGRYKKIGIKQALNIDSSYIGNYPGAEFKLFRGKYKIDADIWNNFSVSTEGYVESNVKKKDGQVILTTGATKRNSVLGIYDLAGNVSEWTLERVGENENVCVHRGLADFEQTILSASQRCLDGSSGSVLVGFRPAMWDNVE